MTEFYIDKDGKVYGEDDSLINQVISNHHEGLSLEEVNALKG
jgi:hypothetical protein